jgi:ECF sigma factor
MAGEKVKERTSILVQRLASGDESALDEILSAHNADMVQRASLYIRRLKMYEPLYEGQEAVDDAVGAMLQRARAGELKDVRHSAEFWTAFWAQLLDEVRRARDFWNARIRRDRHRKATPRAPRLPDDEVPFPEACLPWDRCDELLISQFPPPDDLVLVRDELEALIGWLGVDPDLKSVLQMRCDEYTVAEIAERLGCATRTVDRKLREIRGRYKARQGRQPWLARVRNLIYRRERRGRQIPTRCVGDAADLSSLRSETNSKGEPGGTTAEP